jgi:hypothetical protein
VCLLKLAPPTPILICMAAVCFAAAMAPASAQGPAAWKIGTPIATYWAGPPMTDATARQMAEGGWNLVWCRENELDTAQRFGLRAMLQDGLIAPGSLEDPARRQQLDALVDRVRNHPALYAYFLTDEPNASTFPTWGKLVAYLRERDPAHLPYINLFPTYASNEQLGTHGDTAAAYAEYLKRYVEVVKPALISYDHYHFTANGDSGQYFLNLGMIRQTALEAGVPFLNIVQACSWTPAMRVPTPDELTWLVYTSLAYGAQGISYYVYSHPGHEGAMALADGTPTPLYYAASRLNREFVAIAGQLQPLRSLGAYHVGTVPLGAEGLPADAPVTVEPPVPAGGLLVGLFGRRRQVTHAVIANLDYKKAISVTLRTPGKAAVFQCASSRWEPSGTGKGVSLELAEGSGALVRWSR